jgi:hypothetical protein
MTEQFKKILFVFKMVMSAVYIAIGFTILFNPGAGVERYLPAQFAPALGVLLVIYGIFRGYRAYKIERKKEDK